MRYQVTRTKGQTVLEDLPEELAAIFRPTLEKMIALAERLGPRAETVIVGLAKTPPDVWAEPMKDFAVFMARHECADRKMASLRAFAAKSAMILPAFAICESGESIVTGIELAPLARGGRA